MRSKEVLSKYFWHDSLVEKLEYDENKNVVTIWVELGNWRQEGYKESEPENLECVLKFSGVSNFQHEPEELIYNDDEILSFEVIDVTDSNEDELKLVLLGNSDTKVISFNSNDATIDFS